MDINEIAFNQEKELWIAKNGVWERLEDEELNERTLLNFCEQLATARNLFFNIDVPHLSCSIPNSRYRVNALHPSITATNSISIKHKNVPSEKKFPLENFKINPQCPYTYEDLKNFIKDKKNVLISGGTATGKTYLPTLYLMRYHLMSVLLLWRTFLNCIFTILIKCKLLFQKTKPQIIPMKKP